MNRYIMLGRGICEKYLSRDENLVSRLVFFANTSPIMIYLFNYTKYYLEHWLNKKYPLFVVFRNILIGLFSDIFVLFFTLIFACFDFFGGFFFGEFLYDLDCFIYFFLCEKWKSSNKSIFFTVLRLHHNTSEFQIWLTCYLTYKGKEEIFWMNLAVWGTRG